MARYKDLPLDTIENGSTILGSGPDGESENYPIEDIIAFIAGQIQVGAFNQNNIIPNYIPSGSRSGFESVADAVNASSAFTVDETEVFHVINPYSKAVDLFRTQLVTDYYLLRLGKGDYGVGGTQVADSDFAFIRSNIDTTLESTTAFPPKIFYIGAADVTVAPEILVNGDDQIFEIADGEDAFFVIREQVGTVRDQNRIVYRFVGSAGTYGQGNTDAAVNADFIVLNSFLGSQNSPTDGGQKITIREINVPQTIRETGAITNIAEAVNNSFRGAIVITKNEIVYFTAQVEITSGKTKQLVTESYVWKNGAATINGDSELSDYTQRFERYEGQVLERSETSTGDTVIIDVSSDTYDNPSKGLDEYATPVVKSNNDIYVKVYVDCADMVDGDYALYLLTAGNGTYGVGGTSTANTDFTLIEQFSSMRSNPTATTQTLKLSADTGEVEVPLALKFVGGTGATTTASQDPVTAHGVVIIDVQAASSGGAQSISSNKLLTLEDRDDLIRSEALLNVILPSDDTENLPLGYSVDIKRATGSLVSFFGQLGVNIEIQDGFEKSISDQNAAISVVKEAANTWGAYGALTRSNPDTGTLPYPLALNVADSALADVAWLFVFKSSEYPMVTTTKDYFCIYSTDHDTLANGAIAWAEIDDPELNGFDEQGIIVQNGFQSEFAWLIFMPAAKSAYGVDELFLYFHTQGEAGSSIGQETRLWTTVGGAPLHTATWTDRGYPLTVEVGDNHNGYFKDWLRPDGVYVAHHLIIQGGTSPFTNQQAWATSPDGVNWTRGGTFSIDDNMPAGGNFWRHDIHNFTYNNTLYGLIQYNNSGRFIALAELDPVSYLPQTFIKTLVEVTYADFTIYESDGVIYCYLRNKDFTDATFPIENSLYLLKLQISDLV